MTGYTGITISVRAPSRIATFSAALDEGAWDNVITLNWSAPAIRTTTPTAIGTARAPEPAAASRPPPARRPAEKRSFRTRSTRRSTLLPRARSADPGASRLTADGLVVSATAWAPRRAASCHHHHDPPAEERRRGAGHVCPGIRPRHRHRPAARYGHLAPSPTWM
jgi:hypothetical protein